MGTKNEGNLKIEGARDHLRKKLFALLERNEKVTANLRRERTPLGANWRENVSILENDEVLDALDVEGRAHAQQLRAALARIDAGAYGLCVGCGGVIAPGRLEALPEITSCIECARRE